MLLMFGKMPPAIQWERAPGTDSLQFRPIVGWILKRGEMLRQKACLTQWQHAPWSILPVLGGAPLYPLYVLEGCPSPTNGYVPCCGWLTVFCLFPCQICLLSSIVTIGCLALLSSSLSRPIRYRCFRARISMFRHRSSGQCLVLLVGCLLVSGVVSVVCV